MGLKLKLVPLVYIQGIIQIIETPKLLRLKKHGYWAKSIFRIGADYMQRLFLQTHHFGNEIQRWLRRILKPNKTLSLCLQLEDKSLTLCLDTG